MAGHVRQFSFEAIGTHWTIIIDDPVSETDCKALRQAVTRRIEVFDRHYSRFRSDSLVSQIARKAGAYKLPADAKPLLDFYQNIYKHTAGHVTPLIGQALSDAGYDAQYSLRPKAIRAVPSWTAALDYQFPVLTTKQPVLLDFGAAGKGYVVDLVGELIEERGIHNYSVDAGGDIRHRTTRKDTLPVGLEHPADPTLAVGVATLNNQSLCGSAGNKRSWENYHHILDPHRRSSPQHITAVWVTAANTLMADGIATALFFTGPETLRRHYTFEYAILYADSSLETSDLFPAHFFTRQEVIYA